MFENLDALKEIFEDSPEFQGERTVFGSLKPNVVTSLYSDCKKVLRDNTYQLGMLEAFDEGFKEMDLPKGWTPPNRKQPALEVESHIRNHIANKPLDRWFLASSLLVKNVKDAAQRAGISDEEICFSITPLARRLFSLHPEYKVYEVMHQVDLVIQNATREIYDVSVRDESLRTNLITGRNRPKGRQP
jgi:hypothetical protein